MSFDKEKSIEILRRTPNVLLALLDGLSDDWIFQNEGPNTWSPFDIVGHLIHGEKTDWIPRAQIILGKGSDKRFTPFDRFAQMNANRNRSLSELLEEFSSLRNDNVAMLQEWPLTDSDLQLTGIHPEFGIVTLSQLLSTWVTHDLNHLSQISRVMGNHYRQEVGPWKSYIRLLK